MVDLHISIVITKIKINEKNILFNFFFFLSSKI